jgi:hypothetical protein
MSRVTTRDELNLAPPNLDGDHKYHKLNPALGLSWQINPALNAYAGFSQGSRVPSPIELGCADPANPARCPTRWPPTPTSSRSSRAPWRPACAASWPATCAGTRAPSAR